MGRRERLGALLADGWYAGLWDSTPSGPGAHYGAAPELLAQLVIAFADGTGQWVVTDREWRGQHAAVRHADLLMGERHDLALEPKAGTPPVSTIRDGAASVP